MSFLSQVFGIFTFSNQLFHWNETSYFDTLGCSLLILLIPVFRLYCRTHPHFLCECTLSFRVLSSTQNKRRSYWVLICIDQRRSSVIMRGQERNTCRQWLFFTYKDRFHFLMSHTFTSSPQTTIGKPGKVRRISITIRVESIWRELPWKCYLFLIVFWFFGIACADLASEENSFFYLPEKYIPQSYSLLDFSLLLIMSFDANGHWGTLHSWRRNWQQELKIWASGPEIM